MSGGGSPAKRDRKLSHESLVNKQILESYGMLTSEEIDLILDPVSNLTLRAKLVRDIVMDRNGVAIKFNQAYHKANRRVYQKKEPTRLALAKVDREEDEVRDCLLNVILFPNACRMMNISIKVIFSMWWIWLMFDSPLTH